MRIIARTEKYRLLTYIGIQREKFSQDNKEDADYHGIRKVLFLSSRNKRRFLRAFFFRFLWSRATGSGARGTFMEF